MKANSAETAVEAKECHENAIQELKSLYETSEIAKSLTEILDIQKDLRKIPVVELETPTVVLVGAPNVGKSSIVRAISSGTPEVNDYPFTTRGVTIGHIINTYEGSLERVQVMDTPGLLDRPASLRNEMEKLTFASLAHLPTAVIFVIDPTGLSGEKSTLDAQLNVRKYLKERFPRRPWLDVISKADVPLSDEIQAMLPNDALHISVKTGENIDVLIEEIGSMMRRLVQILEAASSTASAAASSSSA
jgi:nucleolar GTP-binding protein